jgi:DNA-binding winged helix-turn-helix (wHTH) protein/tetratricopeptide (TPR) repeat protein
MDAVDRPALEEHNGGARFEFAGLLLDVARRELKRGGTSLTIYPRAFDALVLLVSRRSEVVAKATMLDALWPGLSVEENSVARVISDLRKALGPAARSIATVQKRGYRLNASVRVLRSGAEGRSVGPAKRALAVLPFASIGGESDKQLGFGLADALIGRLSRLDDIVVRPTSSVARFSDTDVTPLMAGRALRVGMVLCGSVRRRGDMTRCSVQLVDVDTEASVWAGHFDESAADIFSMEDAIAARVTPLLVSELARRETELAGRGTDNAQAYVLAQRGRYWLAKRHMSESAREAVACFTAAVALDPRFAAAYAGLAHAYLVSTIPSITASLKPPRTMIPLARTAAEEALSLVPDLSEAHGVLAHIAFGYDWNWPAADAMFRHALHLDPRNVFCRQFFAMGLSCAGEFEAAVHQLELARELDPGSMAVRTNIGFVLHCWRRTEQAIAEMEACLALDPMFPYARYRYALALEARGRLDDALAQFALLKNTSGAEVQALVGTACGLALAGRSTEARKQLNELLIVSERRYVSAYLFAEICASLGDVAEAIAWLQKAHEERALLMPSLRNNPRFDRLRSDPRYKSVELRVGFWSRPDA